MADRNFIDMELDFAWAAGFLDGEGCFHLAKAKTGSHPATRRPMISVCQVNPLPLQKLAYLFGSSVRLNGKTAKGSIMHQWQLANAPCIKEAIPLLLPHLVIKKEEAEIILEFSKLMYRRGHPAKGMPTYCDEELEKRYSLISQMEVIRSK